MCDIKDESVLIQSYRNDIDHYWKRLMWWRDELWRITLPLWGAYAGLLMACITYLWQHQSPAGVALSRSVIHSIVVLEIFFSLSIYIIYAKYSNKVLGAVEYLNGQIQIREKMLYVLLKYPGDIDSNYTKYKMSPPLHILFKYTAFVLTFVTIAVTLYLPKDGFAINFSDFCNSQFMVTFVFCFGLLYFIHYKLTLEPDRTERQT